MKNIHGIFPPGISVRNHFLPGDIGYLVYLHGVLYARECGWDHTFEAYVAGPLSEFAKSHSERERIWIAEKEGTIVGSVAIVDASDGKAQLRWLLLHPDLRGYGIGRSLVEGALWFCRECGYRSVFLWTEGGLKAAAQLYETVGFQMTEDKTHRLWGAAVTEQRYDMELK